MDEEMDEAFEGASWSYEIDLDYEFDAARYFDFGRPETLSEARGAELWFETAGSYPPSPLIAQIFNGEEATMKSLKILSDLDAVGCTTSTSVFLNDDAGPDLSQVNSKREGIPKIYSKTTTKPHFNRSSTLLKPTMSQLAKQNRINGAKVASRSCQPLIVKSEKSIDDPNDYPLQATKRQRLETGHFCKIDGVKQQTDFIHKVREKNGLANCNAGPPRLKLTIPREPHLETARRAERFKAQRAKSGSAKLLLEGEMPKVPVYKAHPLNRKILEAPSLPLHQKSSSQLPKFKEFNLKTHDRAVKHPSGLSTETADNHVPRKHGDVIGARRSEQKVSGSLQQPNDTNRLEECRNRPCEFKARPLDKKIFSSKGIGIFRSTKREITVPKDFSLSSSKRCQQIPLAELFNKLSLASEGKRITALQTTFSHPTHVASKDSKENIDKSMHC